MFYVKEYNERKDSTIYQIFQAQPQLQLRLQLLQLALFLTDLVTHPNCHLTGRLNNKQPKTQIQPYNLNLTLIISIMRKQFGNCVDGVCEFYLFRYSNQKIRPLAFEL